MAEQPDAHALARNALLRSAGVVVGLGLGYALLPLDGDRWWIGALVGGAMLVAVVPLAVRRLKAVLRSTRPAAEAIEAVALLSAMLIVGFASVYFSMNRERMQLSGAETKLDTLYFTVTTLATVGYGDITPVTQPARAVVVGQMLINLLFLGITVRVFARAASAGAAQRSALLRSEEGPPPG